VSTKESCWCLNFRDYHTSAEPPYVAGNAGCGNCGRYLTVLTIQEEKHNLLASLFSQLFRSFS
jgi:proteasome assembly chaperone (PAC2) family protein